MLVLVHLIFMEMAPENMSLIGFKMVYYYNRTVVKMIVTLSHTQVCAVVFQKYHISNNYFP